MHKLVISDDEGKTTVVPLVRDEITIGRKEGNTIRLTERNVSRRHARLKRANGAFLIEDLESYNGIKVNGRRIEKSVPLKPGDQVGIGDYLIALQDEASDAVSVADAPTATIAQPAAPGLGDPPTAMIAAPGVAGAPSPPARLVMISPPAPGAEFAFHRTKTRIGRAEDLEICVNHRSISREHAELVREGDVIRLVDLGSANGTRVNGRDASDVQVSAGDVIEFGQVRFRFVGEGEAYVFDAAQTMQFDAIELPPTPSRTPIFLGAGIVAAALIGTVALVALSGGDEAPEITATAVPTVAPAVPVAATAAPDEAYATALAACRGALGAGRFDVALAQAGAALAAKPGDADAEACQRAATAALDQQSAGAARGLVDRARAALGSNPSEASRLAGEVLAMAGTSAELRTEAESVLADARSRAATPAAAANPSAPVAAASPRPAPPRAAAPSPRAAPPPRALPAPRPAPPPARPAAPTARPAAGGRPTTPPPPSAPPPSRPAAAPEAPPGDRLERARQLMLQGNNNGVIALLQNARSQQELELLIATYQNVGNTPAKLAAMQRYIDRFPSTPKARQYQQVLLRQR
jgi:pSer/pThr/pTyr-binding forkhead associated (FHA) protein